MNKTFSARNIAYFAILVALVIVLQAALGTIQIGAVQLNFSLIPIVVGAIMFGAFFGAILGFISGVIVLIQVIMGMSPFYLIIWSNSPIITTLICLLKTTIAGFIAGIVFNAIKKKNSLVAIFVASGIVPIINTGLFIIGCLCMNETLSIFQSSLLEAMPEVAGMNALVFILVVLVTFNFFIEFAINLAVSPALYRCISVIDKNIFASKRLDEKK